MKETHKVKILNQNGKTTECVLVASKGETCDVEFEDKSILQDTFSGDDLFDALQCLRAELEKSDSKLLCVGSMPNAVASGMSRSMGYGEFVYLVKLGRNDHSADSISIFKYCEPMLVGSVSDQLEFYEKWTESLRAL
jgi:hypothetical protein